MNNPIKNQKASAIIVASVIVLLGFFTLTLIVYTWDRALIAPGVVLEIPLGNLHLDEAKSKLKQIRTEDLTHPLHFTAEGKDFPVNPQDLGLAWNYEAELQQAYNIGREGTLWTKALNKFQASKGLTLNPHYHWDEQLLTTTLRKSLATLNIPAEDAHYTLSSQSAPEIVPEKPGKQVDMEALKSSIKKLSLHQTNLIPIPVKSITPVITKAALERQKITLIGSYTTYFNPGQLGRTENLRLAAKAIDGKILRPKEVFSFNQTVGPRTVAAGYQMAIIIEGAEFVPGLGGGVCQVSSTLYNAVQQASLSIIERAHHSLAVTYVPPGQDATVAYPSLDFKFANDSGGYLLIHSALQGNALSFSLYGPSKKNPSQQ